MIGPILPLPRGTKKCLLKSWSTMAPEDLAAELAKRNGCNRGVRLDQYAVLDPDSKAAGELCESWENNGQLPRTVAWKTAAGNIKRLYKRPPGLEKPLTDKATSLQLRTGARFQDVIPPSYVKDPEKGIDGHYEWLPGQDPESIEPALLPDKIIEYFKKPQAKSQQGMHPAGDYEAYASKALADELAELARTPEGSHNRNNQLNRSAFALGQLVGAGVLDRGSVEAALYGVAASIGLGETDTRATIRSGIEGGMKEPRQLPERERPRSAPKQEAAAPKLPPDRRGPAPEPQKPTLKPFTARELGAKVFPEPRWAIPDLIPEGLTILGGRPKIGKSWFALNLAVAAATGGMALGKIQVEKGEALYLALEDTPRRLKERLAIIIPFGDLPDTLHFITANDFPLLFKGGLDALSAWLTEHPQARLLVIDTLARVKPPRGKNADPYEHDSQVMAALQGLAALHQLALIVVAHTKKGKEDDFLSNILGSSGQTGVADCVAELTRKARGQMGGTLKLTGRDIQENELPMRFVPDLGMWELLEGEPKDYEMSKERQDILLILKETGPKKPAQLAKLLDKKSGAVRIALMRMKDKKEVILKEDGSYEYSV